MTNYILYLQQTNIKNCPIKIKDEKYFLKIYMYLEVVSLINTYSITAKYKYNKI